eukprot:TRINITY_DN24835_c0_g1_i2.p1 TRINITY_DN24835_c0_g1~~TRINITY_DN24835_c0_g1_i2.p1  ORF type:complete len:399 (+),score=55.80 TRINITY_DN24835_c0_g1_i2:84-1280(+)
MDSPPETFAVVLMYLRYEDVLALRLVGSKPRGLVDAAAGVSISLFDAAPKQEPQARPRVHNLELHRLAETISARQYVSVLGSAAPGLSEAGHCGVVAQLLGACDTLRRCAGLPGEPPPSFSGAVANIRDADGERLVELLPSPGVSRALQRQLHGCALYVQTHPYAHLMSTTPPSPPGVSAFWALRRFCAACAQHASWVRQLDTTADPDAASLVAHAEQTWWRRCLALLVMRTSGPASPRPARSRLPATGPAEPAPLCLPAHRRNPPPRDDAPAPAPAPLPAEGPPPRRAPADLGLRGATLPLAPPPFALAHRRPDFTTRKIRRAASASQRGPKGRVSSAQVHLCFADGIDQGSPATALRGRKKRCAATAGCATSALQPTPVGAASAACAWARRRDPLH